jgi:putative phosphoribosyl transferase
MEVEAAADIVQEIDMLQVLQNKGIATLLIDLLTEQEEEIDLQTRHLRFDIGLLSLQLLIG